MIKKIVNEIQRLKNPAKARVYQRFFKTAKGEYGYGDQFLGLTMAQQHNIAKQYYQKIDLPALQVLLNSPIHEFRMTALQILVRQSQKSDQAQLERFAKFYLANVRNINNWDLIDVTAPKILGRYFLNRDRKILYGLAKSNNLWKNRISIITTYAFIRENSFDDTLKIAELLLTREHDLIHKAVGWMLREIGKRDIKVEERFLKIHYKKMPRTMLRYAIEKFPRAKQQNYLRGRI